MPFVKEMVVDIKDELIYGSWVDKIMAGLVSVLLVAVIFLVGWLTFYISDSVSISTHTNNGVVVEKTYHRPYTSTLVVGKVVIPRYNPTRFTLGIQLEDGRGSVDVNQSFYNSVRKDEVLQVTYGYGHISGSVYIKHVLKR